MSSRPSTFPTTSAATYDGKARIYRLEEMLQWPPPDWLIQDWLPKGAMSGLYGPPGAGKSLLALDWALCVATGAPWLEHAVRAGYVLYLAAEGHSGQAKRARAWLQHRGVRATTVDRFGLVKERIAVVDSSDEYETLFARLEEEVERAPTFVIIDTLARSIEGDENESTAMTHFLDAAGRWMDEFGATVLVIHHGNAAGTRERGHTSFKGAVGALLRLSPEPRHPGLLRLHTDKQRDAAEASDLGLQQTDVAGTDSIVLVRAELPTQTIKGVGVPQMMRKSDMLALLAAADEGYTWREWRLASGVPKSIFNRRIRALMEGTEIYKDPENGRYFACPSTTDLANLSGED